MASTAPASGGRSLSAGRVFERAFAAVRTNPGVILGLALFVGALPTLIITYVFVQLGMGSPAALQSGAISMSAIIAMAFVTWLITMVILVILLAGAGYAWLYHRQELENLVASAAPPATAPAPAPAEPAPPPAAAPAPTPTPPVVEPPKKSARLAISEYLATKPTPEALLARGKEYAQGGDLGEAFLVWRAAAEAGNPQAEVEVAGFYDPMQKPRAGFPPDGARAADWYERAALAGNVEAQRKYGMLLAKGGAGLAADPAKARTWLQQAAAQNDADAKKALDALPK